MASFDQQILEALAGELNPQVFEDCACDLLRAVFPGLFPIRGGDDAGMDGGIADGQGEPFPLVCTTGEDVSGNLTRSLESYLRKGGKRRKVALATSQKLTPRRQQNLRARAHEKGFELISGPYDRHAMKDHLYESRKWCLKLLNLTGEPSALSTVPRTTRPSPELARVGRDSDLQWLRSTEGDRLLVGQPGSGKTYLLRELVRAGEALFLVSDDRTEVANALREKRPALVIVDDAHRDFGILEMLWHLRDDLRAEHDAPVFSILATCWPGAEDKARAALGRLPSKQVRHLELMIRREILDIVEQLGADWSPEWKRLLVDQAANKPGIAVTLAWLCLRGDWHEVATGEALWRELGPTFNKLVAPRSADFLGVLSLGGRQGMVLDDVRRLLELGRQKTREVAIGLAAGGVLKELPDRRLLVEPADLRSALLKHAFFQDPAPFNYQDLLDKMSDPDRGAAIVEIVRAVHLDADLPPEVLRNLVQSTADRDAWRGIAALEGHTRWALEETPLDPLELVREAFYHAPRDAIRLLLERAVGDTRPLHSYPNHPLRILKDWLEEPISNVHDILSRRKHALEAARHFLDGGGERKVAVHAACLSLSPNLEGAVPDALHQRFKPRLEVLPPGQMQELGKLWEKLFEMLREIDTTTWSYLVEMLNSWIWPQTNVKAAHAIAIEMLKDLRSLADDNQGFRAALRRLAYYVDIDLLIEVDPIFDLLYINEYENADDGRRLEKEKRAAIEHYAREWASNRKPREVARDLARFERQSGWIQPPATDWSHLLCVFLAEFIDSPNLWLEAFIDEEVPVTLLLPFLERTAADRPDGWEALVERFFANESLVGAAEWVIIALSDPPKDLLNLALDNSPRFPSQIATRCLRGEIPLENLRLLLGNSDLKLIIGIAHAEWRAAPRGSFRAEIREACHAAILRSADPENIKQWRSDYYLGEVLEKEPDLSYKWLLKLSRQGDSVTAAGLKDRNVAAKAIAGLRKHQKLAILEEIEPGPVLHGLIPWLIHREADLYRKLLDLERLKNYRFGPLQGMPEAAWAEFALLALDHGLEPEAIAGAAFLGSHSYSGYGQSFWRQWDDAFAILEKHPDERLREVARLGRQAAQANIKTAEEHQHKDELEGFR